MEIRKALSTESEVLLAAATQAIAAIQGKWTARVLLIIAAEPVRTCDLLRMLPVASKKVVFECLHHLEERGLVERRRLASPLRHVQYHVPSAVHESTIKLLEVLAAWLPNRDKG